MNHAAVFSLVPPPVEKFDKIPRFPPECFSDLTKKSIGKTVGSRKPPCDSLGLVEIPQQTSDHLLESKASIHQFQHNGALATMMRCFTAR